MLQKAQTAARPIIDTHSVSCGETKDDDDDEEEEEEERG
jgi:hypothetical protein